MNEPIDRYADIIDLPAPRPKNRAPMSRADRAAQFSAFAALSGHSDAIRATERHHVADNDEQESIQWLAGQEPEEEL